MSHKNRRPFKASESGQAVTEYVLLLVVLVALVLGGMYQLNTAFQVWANNYFGEYLSCLLETGELPSIGGAPGDSGICNELFKPFNLADGRPSTSTLPKTGGDGDDSGSTDPRGGRDRSGGLRESGDARGSYVRPSGSGGSSSFGRSRSGSNLARSQNINRSQKEKAKYTGSTESSMPGGVGSESGRRRRDQSGFVRVDRFRVVDIKDDDKEATQSTSSIKKEGSNETNKGRIRLNNRTIAKTDEAPDEPFSIGNFFRLLIIAAIIIALVVLLGGQALQISKGSD